jgi:phosphoheptose isomerase
VGNDLGFDEVFARQVGALARPGDVLVLISTSGASPNVVAAARAGRAVGCTIVALTGAAPSPLHEVAEISLQVASTRTARIQEVHTICLHGWAAAVEAACS